ncbi:bifunctional DNA primase/polymerase [Falsihalocynthiibacter sp. S25ZX9]|uniref:bifunctional DNA primase/polymerase n=1 Tax=Falsihalocynthiibacter sp. S25ZX9 TaxID=3240870 RepID=UPI00350ECA1E
MTGWKREAERLKAVITFPIKITWDERRQKWDKLPLLTGWQNLRCSYLDGPCWAKANGFGILMGNGFFGLDLDSYKVGAEPDVWLKKHGVTGGTRVHKTVSGGTHALYRIHPKFDGGNLPTRANIVSGLDGRGKGGWIAFGEGYELIKPLPLAYLPDSASQSIIDGYSGGSGAGSVLGPYSVLSQAQKEAVMKRLKIKLLVGARIAHRWRGVKAKLKEAGRSRSCMDYSMAHLLARAEFTADEIAYLLMEEFEHGQARHLGAAGVRAVQRCASAAVNSLAEAVPQKEFTDTEIEPDVETAMVAAIKQGLT